MASPFTNSSGESYTQEIVWNGYNSGLTPAVVQVLTKAQSLVDFPIVVRSGARSAEGNKAAGGAKASEHLGGNAVDISLKGLTEAQRTMLTRALVQAGAKRIGAYSGNTGLHIDMKAQGPAKGYPVWPMYDRSINNMSRAPSWFTAGLKGGPIPPMNIPDVGSALSVPPVPATISSQLARTRMASLAPMPMPRPASRMPTTPGSTRMTDAEVAELYRGILPIARPSSALPVDPRLARPPGSLPAAPKPAPIPFLGADGSVKAPPGFPSWVGYGADNRMNQQGLGALLGKPVSLTAPNPAPSFAQQFASRLAAVPSTTSRTVAPGAGLSPQQAQAMRAVPTPPAPLAAPGAGLTQAQMQAIRAVPPTAQAPSFASQFASRIAAVPPQNAPIPATRPAVTAPIPATRPTLNAPIPAGHDQMLLARTGVGGGANLGTMAPPIPATMSAALAASRMAQPSAAPMGLSFADKFSNAIAVGAMMNGGKAAPGIGGGSPLSFAPKAPSAAQLFLSGGYIYQQTPNGYVRLGRADAPIPATQSPALLAQRLATPATTFNPASSGSMWTSQSDYHQASGLGQHSTIQN